jgi:hypothetical protein
VAFGSANPHALFISEAKMKVTYRGFEIEAFRGTIGSIAYSIVRKLDGTIILGGYSDDERKIKDFIIHLKSVVDDYHEDPTAYEAGDTNFGDDLPPDDLDEEPIGMDEDEEPKENYEDEI